MKGGEVDGVKARAPSSAACLHGPPLMSTAGVTCYQQDPRPDSPLSITSRGGGLCAPPPPPPRCRSTDPQSPSIQTEEGKQFLNTAFIFNIQRHFLGKL